MKKKNSIAENDAYLTEDITTKKQHVRSLKEVELNYLSDLEQALDEFNIQDVKFILKNLDPILNQLHHRYLLIQDEVGKVDHRLLETKAYAQRTKKNNVTTDLLQVYLDYQKALEIELKNYAEESRTLLEMEQAVARINLCFHALSFAAYEIIEKLYVQNMPYKVVEAEYNKGHRSFEELRQQALEDILQMYNSNASNSNLTRIAAHESKARKVKKKIRQEKNEQLTLFDYINTQHTQE